MWFVIRCCWVDLIKCWWRSSTSCRYLNEHEEVLVCCWSFRNYSLTGPTPDLGRIPNLAYIDLSSTQLNGLIPSSRLSNDLTTINLSNNQLEGIIPAIFSGLPCLQRLSLDNIYLNGSISSIIWSNMTFNGTEELILDFKNNWLSNILGTLLPPVNVTISIPRIANRIKQGCVGGNYTRGYCWNNDVNCSGFNL